MVVDPFHPSRAHCGLVLACAAVQLLASPLLGSEPNAFLNLSSRGRVDRGENVLIGGLAIEHPSNVLIRGVGPSLGDKGVLEPVPRPRLTLYDHAGQVLATNAGWRTGIPPWGDASGTQEYDPSDAPSDTLERVMELTGAFPFTAEADASLYVALPPGLFTVHLAADDDATGIGLLETYLVKEEMDPFSPAWRVRQAPHENYSPSRQGFAPIAVVDEYGGSSLRLAFDATFTWNLPAGATPGSHGADSLELPWVSTGTPDLRHGRAGVSDSRGWRIAPRYTKTTANTARVACLTTIGPAGIVIREEATLTFSAPGSGTFLYQWGNDDSIHDRIGVVAGEAQGTFHWTRAPAAGIGAITTTSNFFRVFPRRFVDGRAAAAWAIGSEDIGRVLLHGDGPDECDSNGAREAIIQAHGDDYVMHYDGCGSTGWQACQAVSSDLVTWQKTGPILERGAPGSIDAGGACSPWIISDGANAWHMFYLTAETQTPAPDLIPIFPYRTRKAFAPSPLGPWTKQPDVVPFDLAPGTYYARNASPGFIIRHEGEFLQYFSYASDVAGGAPSLGALAIARTTDLNGTWSVDVAPLLPGSERLENSSLYYEASNGLWFLFTNHIAITSAGYEYTDAVWVYWSPDPTHFDPAHKALVVDASTSSWSKAVIGMPGVLPLGDRLAVFYDGNVNRDFGHMQRDIGVAFLSLPLEPPAF